MEEDKKVQNKPNCSVCHDNVSKYQCPACGARTCSLNCFKRHKKQKECSGKSDVTLNKTKYLPKQHMDSNNIQRDYNFLMKMDRKLELGKEEASTNKIIIASKKRHRQNNRYHGGSNKRRPPPDSHSFDDLRNIITRRGVRIRQLPPGMSRNTNNKSGFDKQKGRYMWTLEWILVNEKFEEIDKIIGYKNDEDSKICEIIPFRRFTKKLGGDEETTNNQFKFFIESEDDKQTLIEVPSDESLSKTIGGRLFIEFPSIYVSLTDKFDKDALNGRVIKRDNSTEVEEPPFPEPISSDLPLARSPTVSEDADYCPSENYIP
ncbi:hypothetical protein FOA43_002368 [Brettanomyces nanus]|uniref:HIT-type domain-containing protein n=1 Tax=Eeniella nana TaxID=13502 RepID=A0A875S250_EENNA|nr:uncharacterized protein FOA43_002368 [Brettanomyces nanus]QPG75028.1 hypothetical protein FOA43_002368 [Brettanomyces nanus]